MRGGVLTLALQGVSFRAACVLFLLFVLSLIFVFCFCGLLLLYFWLSGYGYGYGYGHGLCGLLVFFGYGKLHELGEGGEVVWMGWDRMEGD